MAGVATIALIERKAGISHSLFSRYWRDVHGVMAARIPGFQSYQQNHLLPLPIGNSFNIDPFEGIAICHFASKDDRAGLNTSAVTGHIHRDEQNIFRRALLYSLTDSGEVHLNGEVTDTSFRILIPLHSGEDMATAITALTNENPLSLISYDLTSGDPAAWNEADVDGGGNIYTGLIDCTFTDAKAATNSILSASKNLGHLLSALEVEASYMMIENSKPTAIGLRGMDAVRTIEEASAVNQMEDDVTRAVYGWPFS